jgi:hypothetical protein
MMINDDAPNACSEAASYSSVLICTVWVLRTYDGFKRVTNYDASLVFQDIIGKSTYFSLFPSFRGPRCPPRRQSRSWFWVFRTGRKREGLICPNNKPKSISSPSIGYGSPEYRRYSIVLLIKVNHRVRGVTGLVRSPEWSRTYGRHEIPRSTEASETRGG